MNQGMVGRCPLGQLYMDNTALGLRNMWVSRKAKKFLTQRIALQMNSSPLDLPLGRLSRLA
jgi:hypothetical protein